MSVFRVMAMPRRTWVPTADNMSADAADAAVRELIGKGIPAYRSLQSGGLRPKKPTRESRRDPRDGLSAAIAEVMASDRRKW